MAVLYPVHEIGLIAALEPLHLPFTQLQQARGFAYAQPPACCILNHFHPLELFLTHRHHSLESDKVSLQLGGDAILEHLHVVLRDLPLRLQPAYTLRRLPAPSGEVSPAPASIYRLTDNRRSIMAMKTISHEQEINPWE